MIQQELDNGQTVDEMVKDLPLYEQLIVRGQMPGQHVVRNLIEVVRRQAHEIDRLGASEFREVELHGQTIDERDRMHQVADSLALAISEHFRVPIGEHSSMNCPWNEAEKILLGEYVTDTDEGRRIKELTTWLPMETVPTDNTPILVLLEEKGSKRDLEQPVQHARYGKDGQGKAFGTIGDAFDFDKPTPIGWMLPPAIPEAVPPKEQHDQ